MTYGYFLKTSEACRNKDLQGKYLKARRNKTIRIYLFRTRSSTVGEKKCIGGRKKGATDKSVYERVLKLNSAFPNKTVADASLTEVAGQYLLSCTAQELQFLHDLALPERALFCRCCYADSSGLFLAQLVLPAAFSLIH